MSSRIAELRIGDSHYPFILDHIKDELFPYKIAYGKIHDLEGPIIKKDDIGKSYNVCISVLGDPIFEERMLLKNMIEMWQGKILYYFMILCICL